MRSRRASRSTSVARSAVFGTRPRAVSGLDEPLRARARHARPRERAELDTKGSWVFTQFFRILGTGDRLFVHRRENPLPASRAEDDAFEGRLIRFADLSFATSIRSYSPRTSAPRTSSPPTRCARARRSASRRADLGRRYERRSGVAGGARRSADRRRRARADAIALPRDKFVTDAAARAAIERAAARCWARSARSRPSPRRRPPRRARCRPAEPVQRWSFVVQFPPNAAQAALDSSATSTTSRDPRRAPDARGQLEDVSRSGRRPWRLRASAGPARARAPADPPTIAAIRTLAAVQIPADAWLLIESDRPPRSRADGDLRGHAGGVRDRQPARPGARAHEVRCRDPGRSPRPATDSARQSRAASTRSTS